LHEAGEKDDLATMWLEQLLIACEVCRTAPRGPGSSSA
jgi:hypothetical protein